MSVVYLIIAIISAGLQNVILDLVVSKNKNNNSSILYNLFICGSSFICWSIVSIIKPAFDPKIILYSLGFALTFFCAFFFNQLALKNGKVSLVSLLIQFSLVITGIYGIIFWNSSFSVYTIIGLSLIVISLVLIILKKDKADKKKGYLWLLFAVFAMLANAGCSIVQKTEQIDFVGKYGPEFMMLATAFTTLFCSIYALITKNKIKNSGIKKSWLLLMLVGLCNFSLNYFVIRLASTDLSPTIIYPAITLSILIVITYSIFIKKEKILVRQWIGIAIGIVAMVLLSL